MTAYLIANFDITDPEGYRGYQGVAAPILVGGKVIVLDGDSGKKEGDAGHQTVVIEYETREAAEAAYNSAEYQAVIGKRHGSTTNARLVIGDGLS
jgi:uncharacterized protein (DUF1330 family)